MNEEKREGRMEQIYEIEPLLKAGACIQIYPQGYSMYPFIDPRRDEVVLAGIEEGSALRAGRCALSQGKRNAGTAPDL